MTAQEQAAAVLAACGVEPPGHPFQQVNAAMIPAAIRAAVDLVLPEEPAHSAFLPSEYEMAAREEERLYVRDELFAIADALEAPTDAN